MKSTSILLSLGLVSTWSASAYDIRLSDGTSGANSINFPTFMGARHWDSFELNWSPTGGENVGFLFGNHQSLGTMIELSSDLPSQQGQTVSLLLDCLVEETQVLTFQNYQTIPFGYHYGFAVTVWTDPSKNGPCLAQYDLTPTQSDVLLSLTVGSSVWLEFLVDPSVIHEVHDNYQTAWNPAVLNPSSPGDVSVEVWGALRPLSIQVVPEPTVLSLGLMAALTTVAMSRRRTGRRD